MSTTSDLENLPPDHSAEPSFAYDPNESWAGMMLLSDIKVEGRMRKDLGDIAALMESIATLGQLQSILVDDQNQLVAGGRRYTALTRLGRTHAMVIRIPYKGVAIHLMRELEENVQRKGMKWQEHARTIQQIHLARRREGILGKGARWTAAQTGTLVGMSHSHVSNVLQVLDAADNQGLTELLECDSIFEAYKKLLEHRETEATKRYQELEAASRNQKQTFAEKTVEILEKKTADNATNEVEKRTAVAEAKQIVKNEENVYLEKAQRLVTFGDSIRELMPALPPQSFDHIFTDPPYGIPMENLSGVTEVGVTAAQHDVESNIADFPIFLEQSFRLLRDGGFCMFFCDVEHFGTLLELGEDIGFACQSWPLICIKKNVENKAPHYNFGKNYEGVAVFRKPKATLLKVSMKSTFDFEFESGEKSAYVHPFVKPMKLCLELLQHFAIPGQRILDPYCGECSLVKSIIRHGCIPVGFDNTREHLTRGLVHLTKELSRPTQSNLF